ncbi:uncharacterized protein LOC130051679 [Ostrea edulis]|uniref:uncharacterized protein LOC130051679 n=1 Tax=Ostrea edulis TaxID=37623 RepID=UPI0024AEA73B|nr:uncharacterized protein LOC130051679 [Ostrea edulis]
MTKGMVMTADRLRLKEDAVPSILIPGEEVSGPSPRQLRFKRRNQPLEEPDIMAMGVQQEVVIDHTVKTGQADQTPTEIQDLGKKFEQNPFAMKCSIENFKDNADAVSYYTGFSNYDQFMIFYHCLGPCVNELDYKCVTLEPRDQLFLTLMKLRRAKEDFELSLFFQVSVSTVSRIVTTWINILYFQLKEMNIWPSQDTVQDFMPSNFAEKFANTRVILDATEIPVEKPSDVNAQSITWSNYKHRNTIKAMIGVTPRGAVSYVSDAYGGSASDRMIIERSDLLKDGMFEKGDSIMADRGIMVQDLFANKDVQVNTPTFLKGKSQLEAHEVVHDRRVASKRIHVERVIGLAKRFKILKNELSHSKIQLGSRIIYICFVLSNFRRSIVDKFA